MYQLKNAYLVDYLRENKNQRWFQIFLVLLIIKLLLSFIPPQFSTDFFRNLFYGEAFWKHGFNVYELSPLSIDPNYSIRDPTTNILAYADTPYDYPIVQIVFWAIISIFPSSIADGLFQLVIGKWVLLIFDMANFFLIRDLLKEKSLKFEKNSISLIYFTFMIVISTIEGQAEGITLFFMLFALKFLTNKPLYSYLIIAFGVQWKYIPLIILPYLIYYQRKEIKKALNGVVLFTIVSIILSFPILISDYVLHYVLYGGELPNNQIASNPMAWMYNGITDTFFLSSVILWFIILYIAVYLLKYRKNSGNFLLIVPIVLFLKYYRFAFPWYWLWIIPGMIVLDDIPRKHLWLLFGILFPIAVIDLITLTNNWTFLLNYFGIN